MEESRKQFEYYAANKLGLPIQMIIEARKGDRYDHSFDSMNVMQPLTVWWTLWADSRAAIEIDIDWPEANDDFWKDGDEGAYASGHTDGRQQTTDAVVRAIRAAGITVKGDR